MSTHGRLEAQIVAPAAWSVDVAISGGGATSLQILASAAETFATDLLTTFQTQLNAGAHGSGWTVTASFGESGTGLVTIGKTGTTWAITWTSTVLRDLLGFTGNISGSAGATSTGSNMCDALWLPGTPKSTIYKDANPGHYKSDKRHTIAPTGHVKTLYGNKFYEIPQVSWPTVTDARARGIDVRGSFERFWYYSQFGEASFHDPGALMRYYPDASSGTYHTVKSPDVIDTSLQPTVDNWSGLYQVVIPRMIVQV